MADNPSSARPDRRSALGSIWRGFRATAAAPFEAFTASQIAANARLIRGLATQLRRPGAEPGPRTFRNDDGTLDQTATAFTLGIPVLALEARIANRRRRTAMLAYLSFGLGSLFLALWLLRAFVWGFQGSGLVAAAQFTPFCAIFFIVAFKYAYQNWQLRTGIIGTAGDYLRSDEPFLPR